MDWHTGSQCKYLKADVACSKYLVLVWEETDEKMLFMHMNEQTNECETIIINN